MGPFEQAIHSRNRSALKQELQKLGIRYRKDDSASQLIRLLQNRNVGGIVGMNFGGLINDVKSKMMNKGGTTSKIRRRF